MNRRAKFILATAVAAIAGCNVGPDYHRPDATIPSSFVSTIPTTQPVAAIDVTQWWKSLHDPELNSLIDRAVKSNLDIQIALMRLQEARAQEYAVAGIEWPTIDANGAVGRGSGVDSVKGMIPSLLDSSIPTSKYSETTEVVGIDSVWDLDVFGGLRRQLEAAQADTQAAGEVRNDVLTTIIADVALTYMNDRAQRQLLSVAQNDIQAESVSVNVVQGRFSRGLTNELDTALAIRELGVVQASTAPIEEDVRVDQRRLAFLLGLYPGELDAELDQTPSLATLPRNIGPGLPIDMLKRRPDIRQSERELAAATARIGVAVDALYPHVALAGALGVAGQGFGRTPLSAGFVGVGGPEAYWSVLDFGTLDAEVEKQDFTTRQALLNYQRTILAAVEQVDDAIGNFNADQNQLTALNSAYDAAQKAVQIATQRYQRGFTNYLDVLDAQRELYAIQDQYILTQEDLTVQFITLYKALGGGWEQYQSVPGIRQPMPAVIAALRLPGQQ